MRRWHVVSYDLFSKKVLVESFWKKRDALSFAANCNASRTGNVYHYWWTVEKRRFVKRS